MPRKNSRRKGVSCKEASASANTTPKEDDVKVPIEVNDDHKKADSADVGTTGGDNLSEAKDSSSIDEDEEEKPGSKLQFELVSRRQKKRFKLMPQKAQRCSKRS